MNTQSELNEILELVRLEELSKYNVLESPEDPFYNDIVSLAAQICNTPMSFVSFVEEKDLWLKAKLGVNLERIPRAISMCQHTILQSNPLIIEDLSKDPRFSESPFVMAAPYLKFYAGIPLINSTGFVLGTLCVLDIVPKSLSDSQLRAFLSLQRILVRELETRRQAEERWKFMDNWVKAE
jgi:GAF domain-containing protein